METLREHILSIVTPQHRTAIDEMTKQFADAGVEAELASRCGTMRAFYSGLDIVEVAINADMDVLDVGRTYFRIGEELQLFWLREQVSSLEGDYWQRLAVEGLYSDLFRYQRLITAEVVRDPDISQEDLLSGWRQQHDTTISRFNKIVSEIKDAPQLSLAMISVVLRELENVIH
jgi:glutamate dehydrogenase